MCKCLNISSTSIREVKKILGIKAIMERKIMIREIENRRSIRKYKPDEIERKLIEEIIYSA